MEPNSLTCELGRDAATRVPAMMKLIRRSRDLAIKGKKALRYDEFSSQYRMQDLKEYAELAANHVADGGSVLDVATGPG
jgi:hypothetical protein